MRVDVRVLHSNNASARTADAETRGDRGVVLGYDADRLVQIMPAIGQLDRGVLPRSGQSKTPTMLEARWGFLR